MCSRGVRVGWVLLLTGALAACGPDAPELPPEAGSPAQAPAPEPESAPPAAGRALWAQQRPPESGAHQGTRSVEAVGTDASGALHVLVGGSTFAGAQVRAQLVLERLSPQGERLSRRSFEVLPAEPAGLAAHATRLAVSPGGDRFLATEVQGRLDLGGGALSGPALARLGPEGEHAWSRALPGGVRVRGLVLAPGARSLVVLGQLEAGSADFGAAALRTPGPFLARFRTEDGALEWVRSIPAQPGREASSEAALGVSAEAGGAKGPEAQEAGAARESLQLLALAVDADGELAAAGQRLAPPPPLDGESTGAAGADVVARPLLVRLSPEGVERWRRDLGGEAEGSLQAVAFWEGRVVAAGNLAGRVQWAGAVLALLDAEAVVLQAGADAGGGGERLLGHYPGAQLDTLAVGASRAGAPPLLLLGGLAPADTDFGAGPVGAGLAGNHPAVVALAPGGRARWAHLFPTEDPPRFWQGIRTLGALPDGGALVGGQFERPTDFGTGVLTPVFWDGFLVRLGP